MTDLRRNRLQIRILVHQYQLILEPNATLLLYDRLYGATAMAHSEHFDCEPRKAEGEFLVSAEYEAGYRARVQGSDEYRTATRSWRSGWSDAEHDLKCGVLKSYSDASGKIEPLWTTFGSGRDARWCELPFDRESSPEWKRAWVLADIALGVTARNRRA